MSVQTGNRFEAFSTRPITLMDEDDRWCGSFDLDLDDQALLSIYESLVAGRVLDDRITVLLRTGKVSFLASSAGHEAAQIGISRAMRRAHDWVFPYYRDQALALDLSSADAVLAQQMASRSDDNKARQMPSHPGSREARIFTVGSSIASQVPPAVGAAMAKRIQGKDEVVVTTFGDGATSEGDWHAAMNLAAVQKAPIVFACENNGYAISVGLSSQTGTATIAEKARGYGMPGYRVDGMDVLACYYVMQEALERARAGEGPTLIDFEVYRYGPHSSSDDDSIYRDRDEVAYWKNRDPIDRFYRFLEGRGLMDADADAELRRRLTKDIAAAAQRVGAEDAVPAEWMFDDVFEQLPWHLEAQRDALNAEIGGQ